MTEEVCQHSRHKNMETHTTILVTSITLHETFDKPPERTGSPTSGLGSDCLWQQSGLLGKVRQRIELLVGIQWFTGVSQEPHLFVKTGPKPFLLHSVGVEATEGHCGNLPVERRRTLFVGVKPESIEEGGGPAFWSQSGRWLGVPIALISRRQSWWWWKGWLGVGVVRGVGLGVRQLLLLRPVLRPQHRHGRLPVLLAPLACVLSAARGAGRAVRSPTIVQMLGVNTS